MTSPRVCALSVTWPARRAESAAAGRPVFFREARKAGRPKRSGLRVERIELVLRQRSIAQFELYWNIVKPAGREAAIEMAQSRNNDPHDRNLDIRTRLIENEEIESMPFGKFHAGHHLLALVEFAEIRAKIRSNREPAIRRQIGMLPQIKRSGAITMRR